MGLLVDATLGGEEPDNDLLRESTLTITVSGGELVVGSGGVDFNGAETVTFRVRPTNDEAIVTGVVKHDDEVIATQTILVSYSAAFRDGGAGDAGDGAVPDASIDAKSDASTDSGAADVGGDP